MYRFISKIFTTEKIIELKTKSQDGLVLSVNGMYDGLEISAVVDKNGNEAFYITLTGGIARKPVPRHRIKIKHGKVIIRNKVVLL
jgi:hypothetical protein